MVQLLAHAGDNFEDSSGLSSPNFWGNRNQELRATIDYVLSSWPGRSHIDPTRIGAFGFSAGGFTVLTAVGGHPDLRIIPTVRRGRNSCATCCAPPTLHL